MVGEAMAGNRLGPPDRPIRRRERERLPDDRPLSDAVSKWGVFVGCLAIAGSAVGLCLAWPHFLITGSFGVAGTIMALGPRGKGRKAGLVLNLISLAVTVVAVAGFLLLLEFWLRYLDKLNDFTP
jgi:hypothetical protein